MYSNKYYPADGDEDYENPAPPESLVPPNPPVPPKPPVPTVPRKYCK